jgi:methionine synthase I (cobalamin-dependent)
MSFKSELGKQVLILDGAMGTMVQNLELSDAAFGGPALKTWKGFILNTLRQVRT